jgi:hypothetical protein
MKDQKLQELSESIGKLKDEIKQSLADMPADPHRDMMDSMHRMVSNVYDYVDSVANRLYQHTDSSKHLPPISGPAQMNKALKALGMSEDYKCEPRTIYANRNGIVIEASYQKPKE